MVRTTVIEPEVQEALECIKNNENFILTGGAGSGKTYSLVSLINQVSQIYTSMPIVCITYTNNAVYQIRERISNEKLHVSTIHEFMWDIIKGFQTEIKETLVELINDDKEKIFRLPDEANKIKKSFFGNYKINYDEYYNIEKGKDSTISHDHVLILAEEMFKKYRKLCDIFKDTAQLILIDEYQDTAPEVVRILLEHITKSSKKCVVGFFGDSMQSIYDSGVGSIVNPGLKRINKKQNRRNPLSVIDLGNKLRNDGLTQEPSSDEDATNMIDGKIKEGKVTFLYSNAPTNDSDAFKDLDKAKKTTELFSKWDFSDKETKELWLTHSINAEKSGFSSLYKLYNKDPIKELVDKLKKLNEDDIDYEKTFKQLAEANKIVFNNRNRGNLYEVACSKCTDELNVIKDMPWSKVKRQVINKDSLLSYKYDGLTNTYKAKAPRDQILRQLDDFYEVIEYYKENNINKFLKKCTYQIKSIKDKKKLANIMDTLLEIISENKPIYKVLNYAFENSLVRKREGFKEFIKDKGYYLWERIKTIDFNEYIKSIEYQKAHLPFTTQHSVKGSEYDNVLVVLDNIGWNKYNFHKLFLGTAKDTVVKERTEKLLYVCVTRVKEELVVYMELEKSDKEDILEKIRKLFVADNVIDVGKLIKK